MHVLEKQLNVRHEFALPGNAHATLMKTVVEQAVEVPVLSMKNRNLVESPGTVGVDLTGQADRDKHF